MYCSLLLLYFYAFSRRFYPKRFTVHCQYVCSLGIEPTTFALLTPCSNHWATEEHRNHSLFMLVNTLTNVNKWLIVKCYQQIFCYFLTCSLLSNQRLALFPWFESKDEEAIEGSRLEGCDLSVGVLCHWEGEFSLDKPISTHLTHRHTVPWHLCGWSGPSDCDLRVRHFKELQIGWRWNVLWG